MQSNLRDRFPLSPRKFWKKVIEKSFVFFFMAATITVPASILFWEIFNQYSIVVLILGSVIFFAALFLGVTGIYAVYVHYYIKTYYYSDDNDFLTIKKGVFAPTEIHVQYLKIQDVYVDQDILDRIMGLYDVHISSATYSSGIEAHIDGVEKNNAHGLKDLLLGKIKGSSDSRLSMNSSVTTGDTPEQGVTIEDKKVKFSQPISSDVYGLSNDWWLGEIVKLFIAATATPIFVSFWLYFVLTDEAAITNSGWRTIFYVWLAVFVLMIVYKIIYLILWKSHYKYVFGEEYIYMKVGVLSVSEKNMGYNTIQDVKVNQTLVDRIFGVADLVIENASPGAIIVDRGRQAYVGGNGIVIEGLELVDAKKIAEEIKSAILTKNSNTKGL